LIAVIIILQVIYYYVNSRPNVELDLDTKEVIAFQSEIDSLKLLEKTKKTKLFPFNPNFITDYKGYKLGLSTEEIDRLHKFRSHNKYVNSAKEFQKVTQVSDSLLKIISPYFKFPDWVKKKRQIKSTNFNNGFSLKSEKREASTTDINLATQEDFMLVNGVGEVISNRIIKYRSKLKGFTFENQLQEVWGINEVMVESILEIFSIQSKPKIDKINVNTANFKQILHLPYIDYELCKKIFDYRDEVAELQSIEELRNIKEFPQNKYDRIILYLKAE